MWEERENERTGECVKEGVTERASVCSRRACVRVCVCVYGVYGVYWECESTGWDRWHAYARWWDEQEGVPADDQQPLRDDQVLTHTCV